MVQKEVWGSKDYISQRSFKGVMLKFCWIMLDLEPRWSLQLLKWFKCENWPAEVVNLLLLGLAERSFLENLWSSSGVRSCRPAIQKRADSSCLPVNLYVGYLQLNILLFIPEVRYVESRLLVQAKWKWNALQSESFPLENPLADQGSGSHRLCISRIWERH